jgi:BASS family bile acid:Na+ symporter
MIIRGLEWLGRHATALLAGGVLVGILLPQVAAFARPSLAVVVFLMLTVTLVRLDWRAAGGYLRRPWVALLALLAMMLLAPLAAYAIAPLLPPGLALSVVLMAMTPPLLSAPAFALLLGLDAPLALVLVVPAMLVTPLLLPALALLLLGLDIDIGVVALMGRLALLIVGAFAVAGLLRRAMGPVRLVAWAQRINGVNVIILMVFAVAVMDGVTAELLADPARVAVYTVAAFAANALLQVAGAGAFLGCGRRIALTVGFANGNRNLGMLLAVLGAGADPDFALFVAIGQLPIFMLPWLTLPLYRRLIGPR